MDIFGLPRGETERASLLVLYGERLSVDVFGLTRGETERALPDVCHTSGLLTRQYKQRPAQSR